MADARGRDLEKNERVGVDFDDRWNNELE